MCLSFEPENTALSLGTQWFVEFPYWAEGPLDLRWHVRLSIRMVSTYDETMNPETRCSLYCGSTRDRTGTQSSERVPQKHCPAVNPLHSGLLHDPTAKPALRACTVSKHRLHSPDVSLRLTFTQRLRTKFLVIPADFRVYYGCRRGVSLVGHSPAATSGNQR